MKLQLLPNEVKVIQMALTTMIQEVTEITKDDSIPWTDEAKELNNDILSTAASALAKIASVSGQLIEMEPYKEGDEKEFLTKPFNPKNEN